MIMKTITVRDNTWEVLQQWKLDWKQPSLNYVIDQLIVNQKSASCAQKGE